MRVLRPLSTGLALALGALLLAGQIGAQPRQAAFAAASTLALAVIQRWRGRALRWWTPLVANGLRAGAVTAGLLLLAVYYGLAGTLRGPYTAGEAAVVLGHRVTALALSLVYTTLLGTPLALLWFGARRWLDPHLAPADVPAAAERPNGEHPDGAATGGAPAGEGG